MKSPRIESESYLLRPFKTSDAELWQNWDVDPEVQGHMPEPFNESEDIEAQYRYIKKCEDDEEGFYWSIETKSGVTIGTIALTEFNDYHGVADLGIVIGDKEHWGKGVATEVVTTLIDYAFKQLHVSRISAEVEEGNTPMMKVLEKTGFMQDGIFESARMKNGRRITVYHFGIVRPLK